jgi:NADPH:quinone reductase-like Zn-dependent oxidoreductase
VEDGGLAQFTKVPVANLIPMPDNLTFEEAASIPLVFVTAWHMLVTRARVSMNDSVLVNAAGSGVGIAGVQIAKLFGARVIASAGSDAKLEKAKALGADEVINYNTHDLAQETLRLTGGRGVDLVFEHIGAKVFEQSLDALARYGRLVTCGVTAGPQATLDVGRLMRNRQTIIGSFMGTKGELLRMMRHFKDGRLRPVVDRAYPLAEIKAAVNQLASRNHFGKIVLVPPE